MKKLLSLLLATVICLSLCAFATAEEIPVEEMTVELDETYQEVALSEDYATAYIPVDWLTINAEYADETSELLGSYSNADGSALLLVTYAETGVASSYEEVYTKSAEAGLSAGVMMINETKYVCVTTVADDKIVMIANTFVDDECTTGVAFTFTFPTANAEEMEKICYQILGSLTFVE
ncbi:MAG: hypothetical protein PHI98_00530 [Eubacteriales bacterium]|nr:hypothetical protein [Eubacteriales bacterium]